MTHARRSAWIRARWIPLLVLAACSGGTRTGGGDPTPGAGSLIIVENNRPGSTAIQVTIVPQAGVRQQLGVVEGGQTGTFTYEGTSGMYHLIALTPDGEKLSERFRLVSNSTVRWNMVTNNVIVGTRR